jgi:photosystem II stability/assembly factor-like uncharacterized protein
MAIADGPSGVVVAASVNSGTSWSVFVPHTSPVDETSHPLPLFNLNCTFPKTCLAAADYGPSGPGSEHAAVFKTSDGGHNWLLVATPAEFNANDTLTCLRFACQEITTLDYNYGPAISQLESSTDGGVNWTLGGPGFQAEMLGVAATSKGHWVIVGGNVLNGPLVITSP